jgi:Leucine-rich repeat (LRR) protein
MAAGALIDYRNMMGRLKMKWLRILVVTLSILVLLIMFVSCAGPEGIFPDKNLEAAIRDALGKSVGEEITTAELANLIQLVVDRSYITDLSGLEYCTNLTWLSLVGNQISDISALAGLTNLERLNLDGNIISDISPLADLTNLQVLWLGRNNIIDISPLDGLINLQWLNLPYNNINDIRPLVQNSGLSGGDMVDLEGNRLSAASVGIYLPQLRAKGVFVTN